MLLQLQVWAFMLLQEAQRPQSALTPASMWGQMSYARQGRRHRPVHHVRLVHRRHDRPRDRLQRRPQAVARIRSGRRRRAARRQTGRSHQDCRPLQARATWPKLLWPVCRNSGRTRISTEIPGEEIEASKRALERAEAIVHAELKRGISTPGDHRFHGAVRRTVRNGRRHHQRVPRYRDRKVRPVSAPSPAVFRKRWSPPPSVCSWLFPAVWMFNYFTGKLEAFDVEMGNSSSELIDYFLKRSQRMAKK